MKVLRWVGVIPCAFFASAVAWIMFSFVAKLTLIGMDSNEFMRNLFMTTMGHGFAGAAFVYGGSLLAPSYKLRIAFSLSVIAIALASFALYPAVLAKDGWAIWGGIFVVVGAGIASWAAYSGELRLDKI